MIYITYTCMILLILFIVLLGYRFTAALAVGGLAPAGEERHLTRRDVLVLAVITLAYAIRAFWGLGDTAAPQTFAYFAQGGDSVTLELEQSSQVDEVLFYTGLHTGYYTLSVSQDGEEFTELASIEQKYSALFAWQRAEIEPFTARYVRLTADRELYMGAFVLRDGVGTALPLTAEDENGAALVDEPEVVPAEPSYLNSTYFDEIYHARTAYEHIQGVYPYETSHPPLGKLILSVGIRLFGMTPFGWRSMGTLAGVLMLPVLYAFLKRLFGNTALSGCGTVIFGFDFMHFVQTRLATIDSYAVLFILLMYYFMYRFVTERKLSCLALSGIAFGLGAASKWTCIYAGAGLAVIWLLHWIFRLKKEQDFRVLAENILFCLLFFVAIPGVIYYASYYPYGKAVGLSGLGMYLDPKYIKLVWDNQVSMFTYHVGVDATHPYSSRWYQWIFDARPILYYLHYGERTKSAIACFVSPLLCWGGLFAMVGMGYLTFWRRDKRAAFILIGYLAQIVPWMFVRRITFEYHYFACTVFLTLAVCYVLDVLRRAGKQGRYAMYAVALISVMLFAAFSPVLTGTETGMTTYLKWLPSWPI